MNTDGPAPEVLLADKGYDPDFIRVDMERRDGAAIIPTKRNWLVQLLVALYALQYGRALLQQAQNAKAKNPLRQNRRQLPRLYPYRLNPSLNA
jgi:hypothetical protein